MRTIKPTKAVIVLSLLALSSVIAGSEAQREKHEFLNRESIIEDGAVDVEETGGNDQDNSNGSRTTVDGRNDPADDPTDCGPMDTGSGHHHHTRPCEDDVNSPEMETPAPIGGRDDLTARPTMMPTMEPTTGLSLTSPPTNPGDCQSSEGGSFGQIDVDSDGVVRVNYVYEMEVVSGLNATDIEDDILPSLERDFVDSVIPALFPDDCGGDGTRQRRLQVQSNLRRRLKVIGISANPPDGIIPDVSCQAPVSAEIARSGDTPTCVVIDGEFMFFTDNGVADEETALALGIMADNMESGTYAASNPQIVQLRMLNETETSPGGPPDGGNGSGGNETDENGNSTNQDGVRIGLFVGVFGLVAILSGVLFRINRTARNGETEEYTYQADNTQNVSVLTQSMPEDAPPMM